jgi:tripeptidyl-peptidase I
MGVATGVPTWIWSTAGNHDGDNEPFLKWLLDVETTRHIPYVFSISYQDLEDTVEISYADRVCQQFMQTTLRGTTLVTGSGDWGTGCTGCRTFQSVGSCPFL